MVWGRKLAYKMKPRTPQHGSKMPCDLVPLQTSKFGLGHSKFLHLHLGSPAFVSLLRRHVMKSWIPFFHTILPFKVHLKCHLLCDTFLDPFHVARMLCVYYSSTYGPNCYSNDHISYWCHSVPRYGVRCWHHHLTWVKNPSWRWQVFISFIFVVFPCSLPPLALNTWHSSWLSIFVDPTCIFSGKAALP